MTIVFVASNDAATCANLAIAQTFSSEADWQLFGAAATRVGLHDALVAQEHDRTAFLMCHGNKWAVLDNDGAPAVEAADSAALINFKVFAWACHTGATLGYSLSQLGVTWWGYDCAITAPDGREPYSKIFSLVFGTTKALFPNGVDDLSVGGILEEIRVACEVALMTLDQANAHLDEDAFSLYSCCNQLWQRLSVWLAGQPVPCRHPLAPLAYIDI